MTNFRTPPSEISNLKSAICNLQSVIPLTATTSIDIVEPTIQPRREAGGFVEFTTGDHGEGVLPTAWAPLSVSGLFCAWVLPAVSFFHDIRQD